MKISSLISALQLKIQPSKTTWVDKTSLSYHCGQYNETKASTMSLKDLLKRVIPSEGIKVLDLGCGAGAVTNYLAAAFPSSEFLGVDREHKLIQIAKQRAVQLGLKNIEFQLGDFEHIHKRRNVDLVLIVQTLSWIPYYEKLLRKVFSRIGPTNVVITALFYPGEIDVKSLVTEHLKSRSVYYNTYSLPKFQRFVASFGYRMDVEPFHIELDLPRPKTTDIMGTYTVRIYNTDSEIPERLQISGPILMNWYTVTLTRT